MRSSEFQLVAAGFSDSLLPPVNLAFPASWSYREFNRSRRTFVMTTRWVRTQRRALHDARDLNDLPNGVLARLEPAGSEATPLCVAKVDGQLHAISDICPHRGAQLSRGTLDGYSVICPLHSLCFDVRTGRAAGNSRLSVATFEVNIEGKIVIIVQCRSAARRLKAHLASCLRKRSPSS
jgi:3-phenylpropionate/trans-cinnamate dioxygenase ferredoxin subunit